MGRNQTINQNSKRKGVLWILYGSLRKIVRINESIIPITRKSPFTSYTKNQKAQKSSKNKSISFSKTKSAKKTKMINGRKLKAEIASQPKNFKIMISPKTSLKKKSVSKMNSKKKSFIRNNPPIKFRKIKKRLKIFNLKLIKILKEKTFTIENPKELKKIKIIISTNIKISKRKIKKVKSLTNNLIRICNCMFLK